MNKFIAICTDHNNNLLAKFDNDSEQFLVEYMKNMYPNKKIKIKIIPRVLEEQRLNIIVEYLGVQLDLRRIEQQITDIKPIIIS